MSPNWNALSVFTARNCTELIHLCGGDIFNLNSRALLFPNILFLVVHLEYIYMQVSHISEQMVDYFFAQNVSVLQTYGTKSCSV